MSKSEAANCPPWLTVCSGGPSCRNEALPGGLLCAPYVSALPDAVLKKSWQLSSRTYTDRQTTSPITGPGAPSAVARAGASPRPAEGKSRTLQEVLDCQAFCLRRSQTEKTAELDVNQSFAILACSAGDDESTRPHGASPRLYGC